MTIEGKVKIDVKTERIVSKQMEVFYNPVMKFNRDVSVLLLNCIGRKNLQIGSPLAGSGVREIRFLKELKKGVVKTISVNDISKNAVNSIKKNLSLNKINNHSKKIKIFNEDANLFLLKSTGFDYIDIDPFGSPNPFLDSAVKRISREGILAVTATDTAALAGTYPDACRRKYWANPLRNENMHEAGLRILIRKIQLIGAQYEKALIPVFSYSKDHYFRVFLKCEKGKKLVDKVIKQHGMFNSAGPMWIGKLFDEKLAGLIERENEDKENSRFLKIIKEESKIDVVGIYDITKVASRNKIHNIPKREDLIKKIKAKGYQCSETHLRENSIRSDIDEKELVGILKN